MYFLHTENFLCKLMICVGLQFFSLFHERELDYRIVIGQLTCRPANMNFSTIIIMLNEIKKKV